MSIFESHAHYDDERFDTDRDEILTKLPEMGISHVINIGADMKSSFESVKLAEKYSHVYASVGIHPHDAENMTKNDINELLKLTKNKKVLAIGEIGLDFFYNNSPQESQIYWLKRQLELAAEVNLPIIVHSRDADVNMFEILNDFCERVTPPNAFGRGVIHCFSSDVEMAEKCVNMGFFLGIGGSVTYPKSEKLVEAVRAVPLEKILLETDCPYLSPVPVRGKRNNSQNLTYIADKIAEIKQISRTEVEKVTKSNTLRLFSIA